MAAAAIIFGYFNGKLHVRGVYLSCCSSIGIDSRIGDCARNNHFNGNTSSRVTREEVLIQRLYRLLLLDPKVDSCGNNFRMP